MAPDVITRGFRDIYDDLYAFCMIVYEMFNNRSPFASMADREHGRVSPSTRPGMPSELHDALARGLAADAEVRWTSMKPLLRAMDRVRQPVPAPVPVSRPRRWPWAAVTVALAAGVVLGVFVDESSAQADECAEVMDELAPIWNEHVQGELLGAFGTRKAGDGLTTWASRWLEVRAQECVAAQSADEPITPTPCSASTRDRFQATLHAFRTPHLRTGLQFASVIAELPAPEHCIDHPDDADYGYGGLLELRDIDVEVDALVRLGDLEVARARQADYMNLALEQHSEYGVARAIYFRGEIHRLEGQLGDAAEEFGIALEHSIALGAHLFTAECLLELTAVEGARGEMEVVDAYARMAREMLGRYQPERVAELLQVHGLALVNGPEPERARGVALLLQAVEMREEQLREHGGTQELLSQAHESYARGLLGVQRAEEAIGYLDLALSVHQEEFGHGTWRTRGILMQKFLALLELRQLDQAAVAEQLILNIDREDAEWPRYCDDALWLANRYENAAAIRHATKALNRGRDMAVRLGLVGHVAAFDDALGDLTNE